MIKHKGNIEKCILDFKADKNNSIAHIFENAKFASGPLNEATVTFKDCFAMEDVKTQASSLILKGFIPGYDATIVSKIKKSGAAIVAKTHMDELALGGTGEYSAFGLIRNPINKDFLVGGSSSGAVASLTENVSLAIGSDTGDSVRLPASYTGLVGFKPSYGAVSRYGLFSFASSLDTVGWISHNVSDAILTSQVLFGKDEKDMTSCIVEVPKIKELVPKKVAIFRNVTNVLRKESVDKLELMKKQLISDGITVEEVSIDEELLNLIQIVYSIISFSEASSNDANLNGLAFGQSVEGKDWKETMFKTRSKYFGRMVQERMTLGSYFLATENQEDIFIRAQKVRRLIVDAFNKIYDSYDLCVFPASNEAPKFIKKHNKTWLDSFLTHANFSGIPSLVIPFTNSNNMPIGLSLNSKLYSDKLLLSYGLYFEKMMGGLNE